jgi:hypothetical protein
MGSIIDGIIFGFIILLMARLYATKGKLYAMVNRVFAFFQEAYELIIKHYPKSFRGLALTSFGIAAASALYQYLAGDDWLSTLVFVFAFFCVAIPAYLALANQSQQKPIDALIESIKKDKFSALELQRVNQAIKDKLAHAASKPESEYVLPPVVKAFIYYGFMLTRPREWPRLFVPLITSIPLLSPLCYSSVYHARFGTYHALIHLLEHKAKKVSLRPRLREAVIFNDHLVIRFDKTSKNMLPLVLALAHAVEKEWDLPRDSLIVQEKDDHIRLFVSEDSLSEKQFTSSQLISITFD